MSEKLRPSYNNITFTTIPHACSLGGRKRTPLYEMKMKIYGIEAYIT